MRDPTDLGAWLGGSSKLLAVGRGRKAPRPEERLCDDHEIRAWGFPGPRTPDEAACCIIHRGFQCLPVTSSLYIPPPPAPTAEFLPSSSFLERVVFSLAPPVSSHPSLDKASTIDSYSSWLITPIMSQPQISWYRCPDITALISLGHLYLLSQ